MAACPKCNENVPQVITQRDEKMSDPSAVQLIGKWHVESGAFCFDFILEVSNLILFKQVSA